MGENENEVKKDIEIRALTGESTIISISPNKTIQQLKLILKQSFPPASSSTNFHLFLKGVKLSVQSRISSHLDGCGEFIVLVPFTKKASQQIHEPSDSVKISEDSKRCSTSELAESAWTDMMQDLSSLQKSPSGESQPYVDSRSTSEGQKEEKKIIGPTLEELQDLILNMLHSHGVNKLDENSCIGFFKVLESVNCLSDSQSGHCMLSDVSTFLVSNSVCSCPPWLKRFTKAFYYVNIYSGFLLFRREKVTYSGLVGVLDQLRKLGLDVHNSDIEHLYLGCPQIVRFINDKKEGQKLRNAIVIFRSSVDPTDKQKASRQMPISKVMDAMRKREVTFKTYMRKTLKSFMDRNDKREVKSFSLEDLLLSVEHDGKVATKNEAKRAERNWTEPSSSYPFEAQCNETNPLLPLEMVEHLRKGIGACGQIVHVEEIKGRDANFVEVPNRLSVNTQSALKSIGITRLYSHQADSIQASLAGRNVVVATMTSSGKSLCYNIPVLEVLSQNLLACALYLFPTKALAQDQLRAMLSLSKDLKVDLNIGIYDGDTPQEDRLWLRDNTRLLITNPDMLHMSVLPFHGQFRRIISNLRFVIIDEAHVYKGAFGCHSALILRRLRRLCAHVYGSDPSFIFCTATSANPREHAMELAGLQTIELIQNDGSPSAPKLFALWNPPLCLKTVAKRSKSAMGNGRSADKISVTRRSSPILEVSRLFSEMVQHGLRCIAFCKTRKLCELVLCYTREILQGTAPHLVNAICSYRGGYVAQDRRRIESDFFGGKLYGVAATNALELGIDVGHIDVTLHLGFPGSIASLWQQAGRSGRREKPSLAVYVAFEGPLDQYFMKFPQRLFRGPVECCHVDAKNQQVLEQHLLCAALEHPLSLFHDEKYFGPSLENSIMVLRKSCLLSTYPSRDPSTEMWNYIGPEKTPSHNVSIRAIENVRFKVIDKLSNEVLEEIEESKAFFQVYEGSVYLHQGKTYLVKNLDLSSKSAFCQVADLKYYTKTRDYTDVHVIGGNIDSGVSSTLGNPISSCFFNTEIENNEAYPERTSDLQYSRITAQTNICDVTTTWFGFYRIQKGSNQIIESVDLSLPSYSYKSQAVWVRVPQSIKAAVENKMYSFRGGLHAAGHALLNVVPLYIICSTSDLASECVNPNETRYAPERILLYDSRPGGTGISAQVQPLFMKLLTAALELLMSCGCSGDTGCPNCVQNLACHEYNEVLHKDAAVMIIKGVLDSEKCNEAEASSCS